MKLLKCTSRNVHESCFFAIGEDIVRVSNKILKIGLTMNSEILRHYGPFFSNEENKKENYINNTICNLVWLA